MITYLEIQQLSLTHRNWVGYMNQKSIVIYKTLHEFLFLNFSASVSHEHPSPTLNTLNHFHPNFLRCPSSSCEIFVSLITQYSNRNIPWSSFQTKVQSSHLIFNRCLLHFFWITLFLSLSFLHCLHIHCNILVSDTCFCWVCYPLTAQDSISYNKAGVMTVLQKFLIGLWHIIITKKATSAYR